MNVSRREFLGALAAAAAAGAEAGGKAGMPTRVLGHTGARVSILAMGCGSRFLMYREEDKAVEALNRALDLGISYIDTAYSYGNGRSEERVGKVMATRRKEVFLATKIQERNGDKAMRDVEGCLKRLQTDQLDLLHIHSLTDEKDLAAIEAKDGVLNALYKLREQKVARFIGVTCHSFPAVLKTALDRHDFDCTQMALNAALAGMANTKAGFVMNAQAPESFESVALPVAKRKNMGVIAMKIFAQDHLVGQAPPEKLLGYSLTLPVAGATVGMPTLEFLESNVRIAKTFKPLSKAEMRDLSQRLSSRNKAAMDQFFVRHVDA